MKCTLRILDEVNIKFDGLDVKTRRKLANAYKFFNPAAYHMPAYKLGRWDGTISFCTLAGYSYYHLLEGLLPLVIEDGYEIEIDDSRVSREFDFPTITENYLADLDYVWPKGHPAEGEPILLRDYQVDTINEFLVNHQGIKEAATGAGKTIVTAVLSKIIDPYGATAVIVPTKSLVLQTEEDYKLLGLDCGVYFGDRKDLDKKHIICTWQSLDALARFGKNNGIKEDLVAMFAQDKVAIIVDEVHQAKAPVLKELLTGPFAHCPLRFGLTGTIPKEKFESTPLLASLGPVIGTLKAHELQEKGVLSTCHVSVLQLKDDIVYSDYQTEKTYLLTDTKRIEYLAKKIQKISKEGNTLILIDRVKAGKKLQSLIPESVFISGEVGVLDRIEHYTDISTSTNKIIIATYGVAAVGINIPRIFNLVLLESGKSFVRVIQSIGRGIRKAKDKDHVNIYDVTSTAKFSKKHLTERKKYYKEAKYPFTIEKVDWVNDIIDF